MDPGPSRHYTTEDVLDLVMEDEEPGPPSPEYDPEEIDEPIFLGSDDESGSLRRRRKRMRQDSVVTMKGW